MKRFCLLLAFIFASTLLMAQDFQCQVSINAQKIAGSNQDRFRTLREELYKFVNDRKWCQYTLKQYERIEGSILINLESENGDTYSGTATIQLQRPIYKTNYKSTVLNFQDKKIEFTYSEGDPLEYVENSNVSTLTSIIAFYLNLFLAVDFDSFSPNGGSPYFTKCQNIVSACQNAKEGGWQAFESGQANRYWIMENFTNVSYSNLHTFLYNYHRLGLDVMAENPDIGRAAILESLRLLQQVAQQRSGLFVVQIIIQSKYQEIINVFSKGTAGEKQQVVTIMKQIDPANASRYDVINQAPK